MAPNFLRGHLHVQGVAILSFPTIFAVSCRRIGFNRGGFLDVRVEISPG
jgi:hypothetical protein